MTHLKFSSGVDLKSIMSTRPLTLKSAYLNGFTTTNLLGATYLGLHILLYKDTEINI